MARTPRAQSAARRSGWLTAAIALVASTVALAAQPAIANGSNGVPRTIVLPLNKAKAVDLPQAVSDVMVSDPNIVETVLRTARQPVLFGMKIGQANVLFFDEAGRQMRSIEVRVEHDTRRLQELIRKQFPTATVRAESVMGRVVLSGQAFTSAEAGEIGVMANRFFGDGVVNRIEVINEEQVHLQVQVAEVSRSVIKQLGVDLNAVLETSFFPGSRLIDLPSSIGDSFLGVLDADTGAVTGSVPLTTFFDALEQYSMLRTLAEPRLTAVSGETASFLAGGEFPVPIDEGDDGITIEFKKFGVGLDFTPVVIGDGRISLRVSTEVSELTTEGAVSAGGFTVPALSVSRANTTLELSSGGTIMMAGLIQDSTRRLSVGVPGLRQVPVLGALFRSEEFAKEETELVVLVTPYTVRQGKRSDFRLPTDGFAPASDLDMYLFGRLHSIYGVGDAESAQAKDITNRALKAPVGFIVE